MAVFEDDKFLVIPVKYLDRMSVTTRGHLYAVMERLRKLREGDGKDTDNQYYVVNQDEPYANDVLNTILLGEERKEKRDGKR